MIIPPFFPNVDVESELSTRVTIEVEYSAPVTTSELVDSAPLIPTLKDLSYHLDLEDVTTSSITQTTMGEYSIKQVTLEALDTGFYDGEYEFYVELSPKKVFKTRARIKSISKVPPKPFI